MFLSNTFSQFYLEESEEDEKVEEKPQDWKQDLSKNLGEILKLSIPDFGYQEYMRFDEDSPSRRKSGWAKFLELIQRYPTKGNVHKVIKNIQEEKVYCILYINQYRLRRM